MQRPKKERFVLDEVQPVLLGLAGLVVAVPGFWKGIQIEAIVLGGVKERSEIGADAELNDDGFDTEAICRQLVGCLVFLDGLGDIFGRHIGDSSRELVGTHAAFLLLGLASRTRFFQDLAFLRGGFLRILGLPLLGWDMLFLGWFYKVAVEIRENRVIAGRHTVGFKVTGTSI
jgi:hypothetical protein